ncbi:unnamed protein product [Macrosiphum euphorbiae]|uniref:Uncharacterized protein n=1 Tax=Macrosiphum euphorbiae TaxID=13131 RepID=A0AAV0YBC9_9HEMI|nr:unnamed protein product [Macrosiphum euphorbiae]
MESTVSPCFKEKSILLAFEDVSLSIHVEIVSKESIIDSKSSKNTSIASCRSTHLVGHKVFNLVFLELGAFCPTEFCKRACLLGVLKKLQPV